MSFSFSRAHLMRCCRRGHGTCPSNTCSGCVAHRSSEAGCCVFWIPHFHLIPFFFREEMLVSWEQQAQKSSCSVIVPQKEGGHILGLAKTVPGSCYPLQSVRRELMIKQQGKAVRAPALALVVGTGGCVLGAQSPCMRRVPVKGGCLQEWVPGDVFK